MKAETVSCDGSVLPTPGLAGSTVPKSTQWDYFMIGFLLHQGMGTPQPFLKAVVLRMKENSSLITAQGDDVTRKELFKTMLQTAH